MFNVKKVDVSGVDPKLKSAFKFGQVVLDEAVIKDSNFYVPMDEHYLEKSVISSTNVGSGKVTWTTPYARRLYYNPQYNFSHDVNPNARGLWFEAAKAKKRDSWVRQSEKATRSRM